MRWSENAGAFEPVCMTRNAHGKKGEKRGRVWVEFGKRKRKGSAGEEKWQ
jgi:hypothetical protein